MPIFALLLLAAVAGPGERLHDRGTADVIAVARGASQLVEMPEGIARVVIGDPKIADVVVVSPRELLVTGLALGTTTLIVWDANETPRSYPVEVTVDVAALRRVFATAFPGEAIEVSAQGNVVVLSGTVSGGVVARKIVEVAEATGATVIEYFACARPSASC